MNEPCDMTLLLGPGKSTTLEDGGSCEFFPYSTNYYQTNKTLERKNLMIIQNSQRKKS